MYHIQILARLFTLALLFALPAVSAAEQLSEAQLQEMTQKARQGDLKAQFQLANLYYKGEGVKKDLSQAAHWFQKLAEAGNIDAQLTLGLLYARGEGVQRDDKQAVHWLTQAAEQRSSAAQYLLGVAYEEGHGVKQDFTKAYMWYEIAAALEYQDAKDARTLLAKRLTPEQIISAEQMATDWWMKFHH